MAPIRDPLSRDPCILERFGIDSSTIKRGRVPGPEKVGMVRFGGLVTTNYSMGRLRECIEFILYVMSINLGFVLLGAAEFYVPRLGKWFLGVLEELERGLTPYIEVYFLFFHTLVDWFIAAVFA